MSINTNPVQSGPSNSPSMAPLPGGTPPKPGGVPSPLIQAPLHMQTYAMQNMSEGNVWAVLMFGVVLASLVKLLAWHWWQGSLMLLFSTSFLMATYYAKRPRIQHRLSRILCAIFFITFRDVSKARPPRRFLRLSVVFAISILNVILFAWPGGGQASVPATGTAPSASGGAQHPSRP